LAEVDDFRLVLERMTTPEQQPALHALLAAGSGTDLLPTAVCDSLITVAQVVPHALEIVVANHVATWLYGQWLQQEAIRYSLPVVTPHPWETLVERIVNVIQ
jgi:hypothetical protein